MSTFDLDNFVLSTLPARLRRIRIGAVVLLLLLVATALGFHYLLFGYPNKNIGPEQPIPFSHRLHAGVKGIHCRFCHPFVERSARAGIPEVGKCLFCHNYIIPQHPQIRKIHVAYDSGVPIQWKRVFTVPDHVQFRHQPHIHFGFECENCHGEVAKADRLPRVKFEMGFCIRCHQENDANLGCWLACHN